MNKVSITVKELASLINGDEQTIKKYKEYLKGLKRKCPLCGKDFIPSGRLDTKYCSSCQDAGGVTLAYKQKLKADTGLKEYNREYQRRYAKIRKLKGEEKKEALKGLNLWMISAKSEMPINKEMAQVMPYKVAEQFLEEQKNQPKMVQSFMKGGK